MYTTPIQSTVIKTCSAFKICSVLVGPGIFIQFHNPCSSFTRSLTHSSINSDQRTRKSVGQVNAQVTDLWPYAEITAGVRALNSENPGPWSNLITFRTPEGGENL